MSATINVDYIGVIRENANKTVEYKRVPIFNPYEELLGKLKDMKDNPNRTVFDLQSEFMDSFNHSSKNDYNYCFPNDYDDCYISGSKYPKIIEIEKYDQTITNDLRLTIEKRALSLINNAKEDEFDQVYGSIMQALEELKITSIETLKKQSYNDVILLIIESLEGELPISCRANEIFKGEILKIIDNSYEKLIFEYKHSFYKKAVRYIQAYCYNEERKKIANSDINKMYSTETIGWTSYNYLINQDLEFSLKSNFGYGRSSYFIVNITYKDIPILPYTHIVEYYYVNVTELLDCTRSYKSDRKNWEIALRFVEETTNLSVLDVQKFLTKWIPNEIEEMISGLRRMSNDPKKFHENLLNQSSHQNGLITIRAYDDSKDFSKEILEVYKDEVPLVYASEKLSNASEMIENFQSLQPDFPQIGSYLEQMKHIKQRMFSLYFENALIRIIKSIEKLQREIESRELYIKTLELEVERHEVAINKRYEKLRKTDQNTRKYKVEEEYRKNNKQYVKILKDIEQNEDEIDDMRSHISNREDLLDSLKSNIEVIEENFMKIA